MDAIRSVTKNALLLITSEIIGKIITFFYIVIAARYLGVDNFGSLSFTLAFTSFFTFLMDAGLGRLQTREIARDRSHADKITSNILFLKFFLGIANFVVMAIIINLMGYPQQIVLLVYIIGLSVVLSNFGVAFEAVFQGFETMGYIGISHIISSTILLLGAILITNNGGGLTEFALLYLLSIIVVVIFEFVVSIKKFVSLDKAVDIKFCKHLLHEAFPFTLSGMFSMVYLKFDSILLSVFKGQKAVGLYSAPSSLSDSLNLFYSSFMTALFPVTSRLYKYSKDKLMFSFEKSLKYLLVISIPIAIGTSVISDKIIGLIYGAEYTPSVMVLQILIWSAVLVFINLIISNLLNSIDKQVSVAKQNAMAAMLNFTLNLILIPSYSYIGASIASFITQLFSLLYLYSSVSKTEFKLPKKAFLVILSKVAFASFVMVVFTFYLRLMNIFLLVPLSTILYFFTFYLVGGIDKYDFEIAKKLVSGLALKES